MARRRKKYYIPITRSGSSILASLITQWINQPRPKAAPPTDKELINWLCLFILAAFILLLVSTCGKT